MTNYLVVKHKSGIAYTTKTCPNNSHDLGLVVDGYQSIFKIEDGLVYKIRVFVNSENRFRNDWDLVEEQE